MPRSRSAMLIASPIPRVPPVTIATRAMLELPVMLTGRLLPADPACKFAHDQPFQHGDAFRRVVEAIDQRKLLAARTDERFAAADPKLLQRFDAVGREAGRGD